MDLLEKWLKKKKKKEQDSLKSMQWSWTGRSLDGESSPKKKKSFGGKHSETDMDGQVHWGRGSKNTVIKDVSFFLNPIQSIFRRSYII